MPGSFALSDHLVISVNGLMTYRDLVSVECKMARESGFLAFSVCLSNCFKLKSVKDSYPMTREWFLDKNWCVL